MAPIDCCCCTKGTAGWLPVIRMCAICIIPPLISKLINRSVFIKFFTTRRRRIHFAESHYAQQSPIMIADSIVVQMVYKALPITTRLHEWLLHIAQQEGLPEEKSGGAGGPPWNQRTNGRSLLQYSDMYTWPVGGCCFMVLY